MNHGLEAVCAIDLRRFVQLGVDTRDARNVNNHPPAKRLPDAKQDLKHPGPIVASEHADHWLLYAQLFQHVVNQAAAWREHRIRQGEHDDPADKVGQRRRCLNDSSELAAADLVQQDRHDHRQRGEQQRNEADRKRIRQHLPDDLAIPIQLDEIVEADEIHLRQRESGLVVKERIDPSE